MQAAISASHGPANLFLCHTLWTNRGLQGLWGISPVPVSLSSCLSLFPDINQNSSCQEKKRSSLGSGSLPGQVWTKCQQFPVRPHSDALTRAGERPKGQQPTAWCNRLVRCGENEGTASFTCLCSRWNTSFIFHSCLLILKLRQKCRGQKIMKS